MKILTTGILSGLGKHVYERFGGVGWTRQLDTRQREKIKNEGVDTIIHCAFNSGRNVSSENLYDYISDNVVLTEKLCSIPNRKFVFVSTVDVYPKDSGFHSEDEAIYMDDVNTLYGTTKLMSEAIVRNRCQNYLILRCTALLGEYSRKNSLMRILKDTPCRLTLSLDSLFNYVLHSDVSEFLRFAMEQDLCGTFNVASSENIRLSEVAEMLGKNVSFGTYCYCVGNIDNRRICSLFPAFGRTSKETIAEFVSQCSRD